MAASPASLAQELQYLKMLQSISGAGGQVGGQGLGGAGSALGIYSGLEQGTPTGDARAALSAGQLGNQLGLYGSNAGTASDLLGVGGGALGLYGGLEQGGVGGDVSAALNAAKLVGSAAPLLGVGGAGTTLGTAGSGALGLGGTGVLGAASAAALPVSMMLGVYDLFNKQSQTQNDPEELYKTNMNNAAGMLAAGKASYNQPGAAWSPTGVNLQQADQTASQAYQNLAQAYATGQINPNYDGPPPWQANETGVPVNMRPSNSPYVHAVARGGSMNLRHIYSRPFQRFDSGGGAYSNYYNSYNYNAANARDSGAGMSGNEIASQYNQPGANLSSYAPGASNAPSTSSLEMTPEQLQQELTWTGAGGAPTSSINIPGALSLPGGLGSSGLGSLWNGLSTGQQLGLLGGLTAGIGAATNNGSNLTQQYKPAPPPMFANTGPQGTAQNSSTGPSPYGNFSAAPRQQVTPQNINWSTIGQGPMPSFFAPPSSASVAPTAAAAPASTLSGYSGTPISTPAAPLSALTSPLSGGSGDKNMATIQQLLSNSPPPAPMSSSAAAPASMMSAQPSYTPHFLGGRLPGSTLAHGGAPPERGLQGLLDGPGDGTSDDIVPAALSAGEYVIPAHVVSALGNGDNKAGARRLDEMQKNVRVTAGKAMAQNQHPTGKNRAKRPESYMGGDK